MSIRRLMTFASFFILYVAALTLVACQRRQAARTGTAAAASSTGTAPNFGNAKVKRTVSTALVEQTTDGRLGNHANPEGLVIQEFKEFKSGEPVILSMRVSQSPNGLQMSAVWRDDKGKILDQERKAMNGAKLATFAYAGKKLKPGDYTVTGYWGGNIATEKKFKVTR